MQAWAPVEMIIGVGRGTRVSPTHTPNGRVGEVDPVDVGGDELGAEPLGLLPELHHELGAHDALGEAGVVLDVGGEHQLAAGSLRRLAFDDERREVGAGRCRPRR